MPRLIRDATSCSTLLRIEKPKSAAIITTATLAALGRLLNQWSVVESDCLSVGAVVLFECLLMVGALFPVPFLYPEVFARYLDFLEDS